MRGGNIIACVILLSLGSLEASSPHEELLEVRIDLLWKLNTIMLNLNIANSWNSNKYHICYVFISV